ncbi:uncharacterized protein LOC134258063 [Saccostrea cucullata]|uniref:uncharacterized protein LOC134258063 n=1 Tax=Saccostrea cuccullata TaxID=36930 RepID=UPI002ED34A1F
MEKMEKIQQIKKDAELALYKNDAQSAWKLYSQALSLCEESGLQDEYKRILGYRAMVAVTVQNQEEALTNSIEYIVMDEQSEAGFWCAATALQKLKVFDKALDMLIKGFKIAEEPSAFLTEIVRFISKLKPTTDMQAYLKVLDGHPDLLTKQMSIDTQKIVIQKLCDMDCWEGVSLLVVGIHSGPKSDFDKMLAEGSTTNVPVGKLLKNSSRKNLRTFGLQLAVALLDNGAPVLQLEQEMGKPMIHIGLKMYLETDKDTLLEWFFKSSMNEQSHRDTCDTEGNTVLHILVKNPVKGEKRMVNILNYLLENGCPSKLPDGNGKLPIDYVSPNDAYYSVLMKAKITPDEGSSNTIENDDVQSTTAMDEFDNLLKQGNEYLDRNALNKALEMFLKAKELLHKEFSNGEINQATLHNVQCSILECQLRKGNFKSALENALQRFDIADESSRFLYLLGRSHAGLCNWIEAIASFVSALLRLQDDNLKLEQNIISHIAKACPKYLEITKGITFSP